MAITAAETVCRHRAPIKGSGLFCHPFRHLNELARHFDELRNEIVSPLGLRPRFLAPLLAYGFGLGDGFFQRGDFGLQVFDLLGCSLGFLAPLLALGF
jgi:hypothetical protein